MKSGGVRISTNINKFISLKLTIGSQQMDICPDPRDIGHLPITYYPRRPTGTLIAMAVSAMVELFFHSSFLLNTLMGVYMIPTGKVLTVSYLI
jgi:hypothetical protein